MGEEMSWIGLREDLRIDWWTVPPELPEPPPNYRYDERGKLRKIDRQHSDWAYDQVAREYNRLGHY